MSTNMNRLHMLRVIPLGTWLSLSVLPASAFDQTTYEGHYSNNKEATVDADLVRLTGNQYSVSLSTRVPIKENQTGCAGSIVGEVAIEGNSAAFRVENEGFDPRTKESVQNKRYCEINIKFLNEYTMELKEVAGCSYYHGASCEFSGIVIHDASGI